MNWKIITNSKEVSKGLDIVLIPLNDVVRFVILQFKVNDLPKLLLPDRAGMTQSESQRKRWRRIAFCVPITMIYTNKMSRPKKVYIFIFNPKIDLQLIFSPIIGL